MPNSSRERRPETVLVGHVMGDLHDQQRYVTTREVVEACMRPLERELGHKLTNMETRLLDKGIAAIVQQLYNEDRYIPSDQDLTRIDGVPTYLTVSLDGRSGFFHIRWDRTTSEDWDNYLGVLVKNKTTQDNALDRFQSVYDYVFPILEESRTEMGVVIKTYSYSENEDRAA
jgi:hypothetical protein